MIIKHDRFRDVCFEVQHEMVFLKTFHYYGRWINMGYKASWYIPTPLEWITIESKHEWKQLDQSFLVPNCFRDGKWEAL